MRHLPIALFLLCAVVACGGGGGGSSAVPPPAKQPSSQTAKAALTIVVPNAATQGAARPKFIVAGTQSVRIHVYTVDGATPVPQPPDTIAQISATAPGCSVISSGISCTIDATVPFAKSIVLQVLSYASTDGSGTALASALLAPIDATLPNPQPIQASLGGVVASVQASPGALTPTADGTTQTMTFTVSAKDASGNLILPPGNYPVPITLSMASDANSAVLLSPSTITAPPANGVTTVTLTYNSARAISATNVVAAAGAVQTTISFSPLGSGGGGITAGYRVFEYSIPSSASAPWGIASDPSDGSLWFTENGTGKVGKLFTSTCTQTASPTCKMIEGTVSQGLSPTGITNGPDGNIWIGGTSNTATSHVVTLVTSSACSGAAATSLNSCTQVAEPDPYATASAPPPAVADVRTTNTGQVLAAVGDGVAGLAYLVSFNPAILPAPTTNASYCCGGVLQPFGIAQNGWFTDPPSGQVGYMQCGEGCSLFNYTLAGSVPEGILYAPNANLYVADQGNNSIDYFVTSACVSTSCGYSLTSLSTNAGPEFLTIGPDGNVWFTESNANKIGIININNGALVQEIALPSGAQPWGIALGPDGNVWFTEKGSSKIGVIVP
jgi:streptogramin lyase